MDTYLTYFDQFRYMAGTVCTLFLLCHGILPARPGYRMRVLLGVSGAMVASLAYVPLSHLCVDLGVSQLSVSVVYWILMSCISVFLIRLCYEASAAGIWFRAILCMSAENFMTAIVYYLIYKCLLPTDFPRTSPVYYSIYIFGAYIVMLTAGWFLLRPQVKRDENDMYQEPRKTGLLFTCAYISAYILIAATKVSFEYTITPLETSEQFGDIYRFLQYFLVLTMILLCGTISFIMISMYQMLTLQNEKQIITQMVKDRQTQYEYSKENIQMINRTVHDLKHQLRALEQISEKERREKLSELRRTIELYDAVVKTGNEALDTILTEKSVYCSNRGIRLSCTVRSRLLERIDVVDLYTLLGNAIDNAIEAVDELPDKGMKTISLTIQDQGEMLFMQIENYFDGNLRMSDGLPITTKADEANHGFGSKSIRAIAKSYGGITMIRTEDNIFSLEILIPM